MINLCRRTCPICNASLYIDNYAAIMRYACSSYNNCYIVRLDPSYIYEQFKFANKYTIVNKMNEFKLYEYGACLIIINHAFEASNNIDEELEMVKLLT